MCGITGIVDLKGKKQIPENLIKAMNDTLFHRGPDGEGFHIQPGVALGHRRLSIIDLEGGKQPLYNEDHSIVVTYNGEIYNFLEVEKELLKAGHTFRTRCDTEVIVHAWEEWGTGCLDRFNGMFAFALWDESAQTLFLARDRIGIKPLFYTILTSGEIVFGSELKALLKHSGVQRKVDPLAIEDYFTFGYIPEPKTIYSNIKKLEPGHFLLARRGSEPKVSEYWDVPLFHQENEIRQEKDVAAELIDSLERAVANRLMSDVPLGAFLSGGIDSSAIVAMMHKHKVEHLLTCSIGFKEKRYDESGFADLVACQKKTDHKKEIVEATDYDLVDQLVSIYDEPYADSSAIPTYRVCQLARKHVTVALSGDGGDENFVGYRRYKLFANEEKIRSFLPHSLRHGIFGPLGKYYPKLDWAPRFLRGKTTFQALARESGSAYLHGVSILSRELRDSIFSLSMKRSLQGYSSEQVFDRLIGNKIFSDPIRMIQYLDFKTYLVGDINTKVDRASMANSLEVRAPFLDYQFVEWVAKQPTKFKLNNQTGKYILKKSLEAYLPKEILYRKKMGFAVPLDIWFRGSLKETIQKSITGDRLADSGFFDPNALKKLWQAHASGRRDHASPLWSLLMFDRFLNSL